ncbi:MAG: response regulator [Porphyromonadaceae bacterium]|nr:MAG: response regulator [Porphyromonadaceae bacterium]
MNKKVLLIDDDEDLLRSFQVTIENQGFAVYTSDNGTDGLALLRSEKPDLLVLDVMMRTNLEGYNLLHLIKKEPEFKKLPIIILTGMVGQLGVNLASGVEDEILFPNVRFQDKPIDPIILARMIEDILSS